MYKIKVTDFCLGVCTGVEEETKKGGVHFTWIIIWQFFCNFFFFLMGK